MAVLKKLRSRFFPPPNAMSAAKDEHLASPSPLRDVSGFTPHPQPFGFQASGYDLRPLTLAQIDEVWRLDQHCFADGEAYTRETFDYLLTAPEAICFRAVTLDGTMVGFIVGLMEQEATGHITTVGIAYEHRRQGLARRLMQRAEEAFRRRGATTMRLEVRSVNTAASRLYSQMGYTVTQRLPKYYSNGGDGLLMVKSLT